MSKFFYKDSAIIGLDISTTSIKVMSIDPRKWSVEGYGSVELEPAKVKEVFESDDTSYLTDNLKSLLADNVTGALPSKRAVIAVPTGRSYTRTFILPASAEKSLDEAVMLEVEQYIPIPVSTLYIDYQIIERTRKTITILMSAVARKVIDAITVAVEAAGLMPVMIEPGINSAGRLLTMVEEGMLPSVIVDIGPLATDIAVMDHGSVRVTAGIPVGGNTFTLEIAKKFSVSLENAHQMKVLNGLSAGPRQQKLREAIEANLRDIITETRKVIRYYTERIDQERKLEQVLIVGGGSNLPGIGEFFTNDLLMPARVASPWQKLDFGKVQEPPKQYRIRYLTVAGAASVPPGSIWK